MIYKGVQYIWQSSIRELSRIGLARYQSDGHKMVIDFMNVYEGYFLYDIERTTFLIEYAAVPDETIT